MMKFIDNSGPLQVIDKDFSSKKNVNKTYIEHTLSDDNKNNNKFATSTTRWRRFSNIVISFSSTKKKLIYLKNLR